MPVGESVSGYWGLWVQSVRTLPRPVSLPIPPQGNGQCFCKAHVCGQTCAACKDGFFGLDRADYFGCRSKCSRAGPLTLHVLYHARWKTEAQGGTSGSGR